MTETGIEAVAPAALALARRFSTGGRLWCVATAWPDHARHVAVEFVHPVVVGARALPASAVEATDPIAWLRATARPGDAVLIIAPGDDAGARRLARRAPAWGLLTMWLGTGPTRPEPGTVDHVLWLPEAGPLARHDGSLTLRYHLLWELTHVCFEHPGLLRPPVDGDADVCVTCADEGRLGEVVAAPPDSLASVRTSTGVEDVDAALVAPLQPGDLVLVHAGVALTVVDEAPG